MGRKGQYGVDDETVQPQAYLGEEDQLRPSSPLLPGDRVLHDDAVSDCSYRTFDNDGDANSLVSVSLSDSLSKLVAHDSFVCADSSPPSTPAPLPTPSFEATPSGSSFETDPSKGSYDQTPVHIPLSPDPYFMDIEVDVVHDSPVHGDHPTAPASPAAHIPPAPAGHIPPAPAAPIPAAQPQPAPTDPAMIALLELMAEMVNLQYQALNAQREAQLEFHRLADLVERAVNVEEAIAAERASSSHSAQPRRPSVQINPPLPLPPAKRQATAGRAYALQLPGPSGPPQGPISVQPQAYLGEEDQLRPSSPLVHLGKLWSPCLSQYLIRTVDVRGRVKLEVSSPVHSAFFKWNSSLVQASFKTNL
ncbi:hypothetical protein IGI04_036056 [Brassica rapa subsp. trilocularis]|uniref:Uncharacterized protein n=1 Tax=Brassica rapa subsp. trilocularis TaxID=1813537 RepID=A0ABQ7LDE3_BRACM|nr:hypothetical protein IGI04_036056 [Brassica rapa subsp. trilocularis]